MSKIIIITGPSGAGKSSVAIALSKKLPGTWALLSQDSTRDLIKAGFKNPEEEWTEETKKQWEVSIAICCDMIKRYYEADINCVVELFAPPSEFKKWKEYLDRIDYKIIVLLPSIEETVNRNTNREASMLEDQIRENHDWFTEWKPLEATIIDTSDQSLDGTVEYIKQMVIGYVDKT